jgi:hypothetical protein
LTLQPSIGLLVALALAMVTVYAMWSGSSESAARLTGSWTRFAVAAYNLRRHAPGAFACLGNRGDYDLAEARVRNRLAWFEDAIIRNGRDLDNPGVTRRTLRGRNRLASAVFAFGFRVPLPDRAREAAAVPSST